MSLGWRWSKHRESDGKSFGDGRAYATPQTIGALVRETAQNSLDAALDGGPVAMRFRLIDLPAGSTRRKKFEEAVDLVGLRSHLKAVVGGKKPAEVATRLQKSLSLLNGNKLLRLLVIEDYGAKGLVGDEFAVESNFAALLRDKRNSNKSDAGSGGSFGLGSGTLWSCSGLLTVLFASVVVESPAKVRLLGKADLGYHDLNRKSFTGPGFFGEEYEKDKLGSVSAWLRPTEIKLKHLCLERDPIRGRPASGTSALILAFEDPQADNEGDSGAIRETLLREIARNLWPAMVSGTLKVVFRHEYGDRYKVATDEKIDPRDWVPSLCDAYAKHSAGTVGYKLSEPGDVVSVPVPHVVPATDDGAEESDEFRHGDTQAEARLVIRLASGDEADKEFMNHVACARGRAMVTQYWARRVVGLGARPFHAFLMAGTLVGGATEQSIAERFLRNSEPPAHDKWEFGSRIKSQYRYGAGKLLAKLYDDTAAELAKYVVAQQQGLEDAPDGLRKLLILPTATGRSAVFKISKSRRVIGEGFVDFSFFVDVGSASNRAFYPRVKIAVDSGQAAIMPILILRADDLQIEAVDKGVVLPANGKVKISGRAAMPMSGLDLRRCSIELTGALETLR